MALMFSILFNKRSAFYSWFLIFLFSWNCLFSAEATLDVYYRPIQEIFNKHNTASLFDIKDRMQENFSLSSHVREPEVLQFAKKAMLNEDEVFFLRKSLKANRKSDANHNLLKELVGFIFYPHQQLKESVKTNFNQLSMVLRAGILIAAEFGFKPAQDLLAASDLGKMHEKEISTFEEIDNFLQIPFCLEDVGILNEVKTFVLKDDNLAQLLDRVEASQNRVYLINVVNLLKALSRKDLIEKVIRKAIQLQSKRGLIELGFFFLDRNFDEGKEFFEFHLTLDSGLRAYGLWKIAQCFRYGKKVERNLEKANTFYMEAISLSLDNPLQRFPEIHYDAGDFAVYCALSTSVLDQKILALQQSLTHFQQASQFGMRIAFVKEAEIAEKLVDLHQLQTSYLAEISLRAARAGYFEIANKIAKKHSISINPGFLKIWSDAEQLYLNYTRLYRRISEKAKKW